VTLEDKAWVMPPLPPPERVGVLVVRLWFDHPSREGMRARVIYTTDLEAGRDAEQVTTAATADDLVRLVCDWIEQCVRGVTST
jgi:hypothetical protein